MTLQPFGARLAGVLAERGRLCVGVDPHASLLADWGLADDGAGLREFGLRVVEAAAGRVGIVKPQAAFFERHGSAGYAALEDVLAAARAAGLLVIGDAKRGDIGSTMDAYGESWLTPGSPLEVDAATLTPYAGMGSLDSALARALEAGKGAFVLAATSNPEAGALQTARLDDGGSIAGTTVAGSIAADVHRRNLAELASGAGTPVGSIGVVIGATVRLEDRGIDPADLVGTPILAPGLGFQGGRAGDLGAVFGDALATTVVSSSRGVLQAGPAGVAEAIARQAEELADA